MLRRRGEGTLQLFRPQSQFSLSVVMWPSGGIHSVQKWRIVFEKHGTSAGIGAFYLLWNAK